MEVFRAVMLSGTVKGAGELMHISQPAASKLLAQAERRIGFHLFDRVRGRLVPTQRAYELYPEIEALWKNIDKVRSVTRKLAAPGSGSLRVASSARFCTYLLPTAAVSVCNTFPQIAMHIDMVMPHLVSDAVARGLCDLGIEMMPTEHPDLEIVETFECGLVCVMPEDHPLSHKKTIRASDLRSQRLVALTQAPPFGHLLEHVYGDLLKNVRVDLEVTSGSVACWFVQAGGGIAVLDAPTVAGTVFKGLTARPFKPSPRLQVDILRNRNRQLTPAACTFCEQFHQLWKQYVP